MIQTVWQIQRKYFSIGWFRRPSSIRACSGALGAVFEVAMRALDLLPLYRGELETAFQRFGCPQMKEIRTLSDVALAWWDAGSDFRLPGHHLIARPISRPGAIPARYKHYRPQACLVMFLRVRLIFYRERVMT
jgi:hypothetical protein